MHSRSAAATIKKEVNSLQKMKQRDKNNIMLHINPKPFWIDKHGSLMVPEPANQPFVVGTVLGNQSFIQVLWCWLTTSGRPLLKIDPYTSLVINHGEAVSLKGSRTLP